LHLGGSLLFDLALALAGVVGGSPIKLLCRAAVPPGIDFSPGTLAQTADEAAYGEALFLDSVVKSGLATEELLWADKVGIGEDGIGIEERHTLTPFSKESGLLNTFY
jgi:hypothetical protein